MIFEGFFGHLGTNYLKMHLEFKMVIAEEKKEIKTYQTFLLEVYSYFIKLIN